MHDSTDFRRLTSAQHIQRIADDGQRPQAQKVHLQQAKALNRPHRVLRRDDLVVALQGDVFHHRLARNQHACRVGGGVARHTLQRHGGVNQPMHFRLFVVHGFEKRRERQRFFQRHAEVEGNRLRDRVRILIAHA